MDSRMGPRTHDRHVHDAPGLVHLETARMGCADSRARLPGLRHVLADAGDRRASRAGLRNTVGRCVVRTRRRTPSFRTGFTCAKCRRTTFERERDILDVWFDSGSSHQAVLEKRADLAWPADLYLEGTDQYRGWFQSSLLVGIGTRNHAPYKSVLTHGFVVDEHGHKMSKSLGNVVSPQQVIKDSGAEVLRLWVSMVDYRDEVRLGKEVLSRTIEAYRKIRNTFRYLLSNLYDFDPATDAVAPGEMPAVDRYALSAYARLAGDVRRAYEAYNFQAIFHAINEFVTVDLSAFYLDVSKDRLYTFGARSRERRSAQTAVMIIADGLARLLAPILSVTADEIWLQLPGQREASVHLSEFPADRARSRHGATRHSTPNGNSCWTCAAS